MNSLTLKKAQTLAIEPEGKRVLIVIYKNGQVEVCRKEYLSMLLRFIGSSEERIFKGRLRLFKTSAGIGVEVKKELIGTIPVNKFVAQLQNTNV